MPDLCACVCSAKGLPEVKEVSRGSLKEIEFQSGLNVLLAEKAKDASQGQTRNRAGKTSLVETINFLTGAKVEGKTPFSSQSLRGLTFGMEMDLRGARTSVERLNRSQAKPIVNGVPITGKAWQT